MKPPDGPDSLTRDSSVSLDLLDASICLSESETEEKIGVLVECFAGFFFCRPSKGAVHCNDVFLLELAAHCIRVEST